MRELRLEMPSPVAVEYPVSRWGTSAQTMMFRRDTYLPFALKLAKERAGGGRDLSVVSAGCSNGAELDSILALNRAGSDPREIAIRGYDINPELVVDAMRGICLAYDLGRSEDLERLGFNTRQIMRSTHVNTPMLEVDAAPLRRDTAVDAVLHDLEERLPESGGRDLVLANNLLYHMSAAEAYHTAYNLASVLSDHGVISFGKDGMACDSPGQVGDITGMLSHDFDLEPVFRDVNDNPVMFGRV